MRHLIIFFAAIIPMNAIDAMPTCIADWSIAAPIVHREGLTTVETLSRLASARIAGNIVRTTLCEEQGAFVYRLVVRDAHGRLFNLTLDARAPFAGK